MKFNKFVLVGFISFVTLINLGACISITATNDTKEKPSMQIIENKDKIYNKTIEKNNSGNINIEDITFNKNKITNNYNDYSKEYNYYTDNDDDEENQKITDLETQMNLLKSQNDANEQELNELKEQKNNSNKTTILAVNRGEYKQPWVGPQTHLCPYSAGWPAICGECGQQGGIHQDIIEWMDDNNDCHLTHKECFAKYCVNNNVWPNNHYKDKI